MVMKLKKDALWGYVFILGPVVAFIAFTLYPVFQAFYLSFQDYKPLKITYVGLENYRATLANPLFYKALKNTFAYTLVTVPLSVLKAFLVALLILPFSKRLQSFFKGVFYLPGIASGVAIAFVWKWIYDPLPSGLLNSLISQAGAANQNWLGSSKTAMLSLILMVLLSGLGSSVIIYIAALVGIDPTYYEAADMDGSSFWQKIRFIVWPMVKPTTVFLSVTGVINAFQSFQNAYLMTGGGPDNETTMAGLLVFNNAFQYFKYGEACAQALLLAAIIAIFAVVQFKLTGQNIEY